MLGQNGIDDKDRRIMFKTTRILIIFVATQMVKVFVLLGFNHF